MKKSFFSILPFFIFGCGYGSFYEANISCEKWKNEGGNYIGIIEAIKKNDKNSSQPKYLFVDTVNNFPMRKCQFDKETNQIIGLDVINREKNKKYYFSQNKRLKNSPTNIMDIDLEWKINKRFRY